MRRLAFVLGALASAGLVLVLTGEPATAHPEEQPKCDFLTGGGFIVRDSGAKANFGVGGGCKHGSPTWGHLQYIDHGNGLNVHWETITGYFFRDEGFEGTDPRTGQPTGTRIICGTARTNTFGPVDFAVKATDKGEPGSEDEFYLRLTQGGVIVYTTEGDTDHTLGGSGRGGGNIQLHKPNPSTSGSFGGTCAAAPEID